jgi:hypothetical protein
MFRQLLIEALYAVANACCVLADRLTPVVGLPCGESQWGETHSLAQSPNDGIAVTVHRDNPYDEQWR